jgi:hypothetical protein
LNDVLASNIEFSSSSSSMEGEEKKYNEHTIHTHAKKCVRTENVWVMKISKRIMYISSLHLTSNVLLMLEYDLSDNQ